MSILKALGDTRTENPPMLPVKRLKEVFRQIGSACRSISVITEWWSGENPYGIAGREDIDPESGEPTGYTMTQHLRSDGDITFPAVAFSSPGD